MSVEKFGQRYKQAILLSICGLLGFSIRLSLAVALVDMTDVNSTSTNESDVQLNAKCSLL